MGVVKGVTSGGVATEVLVDTDGTLQTSATMSASSIAINDGTVTARKATVTAGGALEVSVTNPTVYEVALSSANDSVEIASNTAKDGSGTTYNPLLDADGHLQIDVLTGGGAGTQYTEDVATADPIVGSATVMERDDVLSAVTPVEGDWIGLRGNANGALWTAMDAMPLNTTASGTIDANGETVSIALPAGCATTAVQITGTWVGQLEFEGTVDATNYVSVEASNGTATVNATAGNDIFILPGSGYHTLRLRASSWTSGTATITFIASVGTSASILTGSIPAGTNSIGTVDLGVNNDVTVTSGAITETNSGTIAGDTTSIDGKITACNTGAVVISSGSVTADTELTTDDLDSGAGTDTRAVIGLIGSASGGGEIIPGSATNGLLVNLGANNDVTVTSGAITETNSGTIAGDTTSIDGKITACNTGAVVVASGAITETNSGTIAGDTTSIDGKITACNTGAVVVSSGAITETNSGAIKTAVEIIDNAVAAEGAALGSGVLLQGDDGTDRKNVNVDATTGDVQVDVTNTITETNSGTIAGDTTSIDGKITACNTGAVVLAASDGTDIGNVDVASCDGIAAEGGALGNGILLQGDDGTDRKNINVDATTGDVQVDVTNTITETNSGTIAGDTTSIDGKITACNTGAVTISAALPAGSNAIGKLAANTGVDIGDVDVTSITGVTMSNAAMQITGDEAHDAADAGNPVKIGGRAQDLIGANPEEVADNDRVDALFDTSGRMGVCAGSDYKYADINDALSGNNTIIAATAGKRIAVWHWDLISDGTVDARWEDGAGGTAFTGQYPFQAREGISAAAGGLIPLFVGTANTLLNLELSAAINVHGSVAYTLEDD